MLALAPSALLAFHVFFGLLYAAVSFGGKSVLLLLLCGLSFSLARACAGRRGAPLLLWAAHCGALLWVQSRGKLPLRSLLPAGGAWLDGWGGLTRWDTSFNMAVLRLLSFSLDLHWARAAAAQKTPVPSPVVSDPLRALAEQPADDYSLSSFLAYTLFPPLAIAGPVLSYNSFANQLRALQQPPPAGGGPQADASAPAIARYAARLAATLACLELCTHGLHANAVATSGAWRRLGLGPGALAAVGYFTLAFMWLKFCFIWRFFRLWALACGFVAPENMLRCFSNNYDVEGFWRGWHASFNRWLVRYLYVPLGGSGGGLAWRLLNVTLVFTFVALWHDLAEPRLLGWAWASALCLAPELLLKRWAARSGWARAHGGVAGYRHASAALAALNIGALMAACLMGFVLGVDGLRWYAGSMVAGSVPGTRPFLALTGVSLFSAAQLMFELRRSESAARLRATPP